MKKTFLLLFMLLPVSFAISSEIKDGITVVDFKTLGLEQHIGAQVAGAISSKLVEAGTFTVMERSQMEEILKEQAFQSSGSCDDQSCLIEVGQLLGVDFIIAGEIGKLEQSYTINIKLLEIKTGKIVKQKYLVVNTSLQDLLATQLDGIIKSLFVILPEKIVLKDSVISVLVDESKKIQYSILPENSDQSVTVQITKSGIIADLGNLTVKGLQPGVCDVLVKSIANPAVAASLAVTVSETDAMKTKRIAEKNKNTRRGIKIALASGCGLVAVGGLAYGYLNQTLITTKQSEYDASRDYVGATDLGNQMDGKVVQRNAGYIVGVVAAAATLGITIFF